MLENNEPFFTAAFGKDVAKSLIISAATTAGMILGMAAVGAAITWNEKRKKNSSATQTPN